MSFCKSEKQEMQFPRLEWQRPPSTCGQCSQQWQGTSLIRQLCRPPGASLWLSSQQSFSPFFSSYMQLLPYSLSLLLVTTCLSLGAERRLYYSLSTFNLFCYLVLSSFTRSWSLIDWALRMNLTIVSLTHIIRPVSGSKPWTLPAPQYHPPRSTIAPDLVWFSRTL